MKLRIESTYSDGHESLQFHYVPAPTRDELTIFGEPSDEWWDKYALPLTGDGHGLDASLGYYYTATILDEGPLRLLFHGWSG